MSNKVVLNEEKKVSFFFFKEIYLKFKKEAEESEKLLNVYKNVINANMSVGNIAEEAENENKLVLSFQTLINNIRTASVMNLRAFTFWAKANDDKKIKSKYMPGKGPGAIRRGATAVVSGLGGLLSRLGIREQIEGPEKYAKTNWKTGEIDRAFRNANLVKEDFQSFFNNGYLTENLLKMFAKVMEFPSHNQGLYQVASTKGPTDYFTGLLQAYQKIQNYQEEITKLIKKTQTSAGAISREFDSKKKAVKDAGVGDLTDDELMLILQYSELQRGSGRRKLEEGKVKINPELQKHFGTEKWKKLQAALAKLEGKPELLKQLGIDFEEEEQEEEVVIDSLEKVYALDGKKYVQKLLLDAGDFLNKKENLRKMHYQKDGKINKIAKFIDDANRESIQLKLEDGRIESFVSTEKDETERITTFSVSRVVFEKEPEVFNYEDSEIKIPNEGDKEILDKFFEYLKQQINKLDEAINNKRVKRLTGVDIGQIIEEFKYSNIVDDNERRRFDQIASKQPVKLTKHIIKVIKAEQKAKKQAKAKKAADIEKEEAIQLIPDMLIQDIKDFYGDEIKQSKLGDEERKAIVKRLTQLKNENEIELVIDGEPKDIIQIMHNNNDDIEIVLRGSGNTLLKRDLDNFKDIPKPEKEPEKKKADPFKDLEGLRYDLEMKDSDEGNTRFLTPESYESLVERFKSEIPLVGTTFNNAFSIFVNFIGDTKELVRRIPEQEVPYEPPAFITRRPERDRLAQSLKKAFNSDTFSDNDREDILSILNNIKEETFDRIYNSVGNKKQGSVDLEERIIKRLLPLVRNITRKQWQKRIM